MKTLLVFFIFASSINLAYSSESKDIAYYMDNHRRPFNWYSPYPYEYYYRQRDGNDGCGWQYTSRGLIYSCR